MEKIAAIIFSRNSEKTLAACLQSVLGQSYAAAEIIVVDDSSKDRSVEVARAFAGRGVRCQSLTLRNRNLSLAHGIQSTSSEIICCIDARDFIEARYFEGSLRSFSNPRVGMVYSDITLGPGFPPQEPRPSSTAETTAEPHYYIHPGSLVRRSALATANALLHGARPGQQAAWCDWRRMLDTGYIGVKQAALYFTCAPWLSELPPLEPQQAEPACSPVQKEMTIHDDAKSQEPLHGPVRNTFEFITEDRFDEEYYLDANRDVREALSQGWFKSGYEHYTLYGREEKRAARPRRV